MSETARQWAYEAAEAERRNERIGDGCRCECCGVRIGMLEYEDQYGVCFACWNDGNGCSGAHGAPTDGS